MKEESIGPPSKYLGGKLREVELDNGTKCWTFSSSQYVQDAVKNVEECLAKKGEKLAARALTPLSDGYRPEIDVTSELADAEVSYYDCCGGLSN